MAAATILIADDEEGHRSLLEMLLTLDGHEIVAVANGKDALAYLKEHTPDLAILDVHMPDVNGIDLCQRMRRVSRLRDVPVIILTALRDEKTQTMAKMAKADLLITKPLEGKDFRATVTKVMSEGRTPDQD
jgi:DNA-binding response OmpR family regulator